MPDDHWGCLRWLWSSVRGEVVGVAVRGLADLKAVVPLVAGFEPAMRGRSEGALRAVTGQLRQRLASGEGPDGLLAEGFAAVREAARRSAGQRHRDVQILAGAAVHAGVVAEVEDGEGKTLSAVLVAYLAALAGRGVHVVTMTTDLARRDAARTTPIYRALGLEVGVVAGPAAEAEPETRQSACAADVTYGACADLACDYLRDNMVQSSRHVVQRGHAVAIVDDAEATLVNWALVPATITARGTEQRGRVLASITRRAYLRLYERLGGLSSTVTSASAALEAWFELDVVQIPTHRPSMRIQRPDELHLDREDQHAAVARVVEENHRQGRPILIHSRADHVGMVDQLLDHRGIHHVVIHVDPFDLEAESRAMAEVGRWGQVSVIYRLPWGVDVPLGGPPGDRATSSGGGQDGRQRVIDGGGLLVIGLERHTWCRRHDERLAQCAGRRGEPGECRFILVVDDKDLAQWGDDAEENKALLRGVAEGQEVPGFGDLTAIIATGQWADEAAWIAAQDPLIAHDDIATDRRNACYAARRWMLQASHTELDQALRRACHTATAHQVDGRLPVQWTADQMIEATAARAERLGAKVFYQAVRQIACRILDQRWRHELQRLADESEHLASLPDQEQIPALQAIRWATPPDVDFDHPPLARDLVDYVLNATVEVRSK